MKKQIALGAVIFFISVVAVIFSFNNDVDSETLVSDALTDCSSKNNRSEVISCVRKNIEKYVAKAGIKPFIDSAGEIFAKGDSGMSPTQCHDILHAIGQIGGIHSNNINNTISQCSGACTYGCFHGVIEGHLLAGGDIIGEIENLCQVSDGGNNFKGACYHGLGHGVASIAGFDFRQALSYCDLIIEDRYKIDCGAGVIMELYEPGSFDHALLDWPSDISEFCGTLWTPYSNVCYTSAGLHEYGRSQDIQKAFQTCKIVPANFEDECYVSIGRNFYYVFQGSPEDIIKACKNNNEEPSLSCIRGAIDAGYNVDPNSQNGYEICNQLGDKLKTRCLDYIN